MTSAAIGRRLGFLVLMAGLLAGCKKENRVNVNTCEEGLINEGQECDAAVACACGSEGICFDGLCRKQCESDAACSGGGLCIKDSAGNGACMFLSEQQCGPEQPCSNPRLVCGDDGMCRLPCNESNPCRSNDQQCLFGACYGKNEPDAYWTCEGQDPRKKGYRCNGAVLEACNLTGLGWQPLFACASSGLCDEGLPDGTCAPARCEAGENRCVGSELQACEDDLTGWRVEDNCASSALCELGRNAADPACVLPTCTAGTYACEGVRLQVCNAELTGWDLVDVCESTVLCTGGLGDHQCQNATCLPGTVSCKGSNLERCRDDGTGTETLDTCGSVGLCLESLALDLTADELECAQNCTPGEHVCDGTKLMVCNTTGVELSLVDDCATEGLCADALETGTCAEPCAPGSGVCDGAVLSLCNADRTGYDEAQTCSSAALCLPGPNAKCLAGGPALIDDVEDGDLDIIPQDGRVGAWTAAVETASDGLVSVVETPDRPGSLYAVRYQGSNFVEWGSELLATFRPDLTSTYDASDYAGIQFWARRATPGKRARVILVDRFTMPEFGDCDEAAGTCYGYFGADFELAQTWRLYQFTWEQLSQGFSPEHTEQVDVSELVRVGFKFDVEQDLDVYIDDLAFLPRQSAGACTAGTLRCSGPSLERCVAGGDGWELVDNCVTERACDEGRAEGLCPQGCTPGDGLCRGRELWRCDESGDGYVEEELCASPTYCVPGAHNRCNAPAAGVIDDFERGTMTLWGGGTELGILQHDGRNGPWYSFGAAEIGLVESSAASAGAYSSLSVTVPESGSSTVSGAGFSFRLGGGGEQPYDASAYAGVYLIARSSTSSALRLNLTDGPAMPADGCTGAGCTYQSVFSDWFTPTGEWRSYKWDFSDFTRDAAAPAALPDAPETTDLRQLGFAFDSNTPAERSLEIDEIGLYPASVAGACTTGGWACLGPVLQRCNAAGTALDTMDVCTSAEACGAGRAAGICPSTCEPGAAYCDGAKLRTCITAGSVTGFTTSETCASGALCEPGATPRCWTDALIDHFEHGTLMAPQHDGRYGAWSSASWQTGGSIVLTNASAGSERVLRAVGTGFTLVPEEPADLADGFVGLFGVGGDGPFDATAAGYTGIRFRARSLAGALTVTVDLQDGPNRPEGGLCSTADNTCYNFFQTEVDVTSAWQTFTIHWTDLARPWALPAGLPWDDGAPHPEQLFGFRWQFRAASFTVELDDVEFLTD